MTSITVYTNPHCGPCHATKALLSKRGLSYVEVDASSDARARDFLRSLGYQTAPVVVVERDGKTLDHWWGFRPAKINGLAGVAA